MELGMMISGASELEKRQMLAETIKAIRNANGDGKYSNAFERGFIQGQTILLRVGPETARHIMRICEMMRT